MTLWASPCLPNIIYLFYENVQRHSDTVKYDLYKKFIFSEFRPRSTSLTGSIYAVAVTVATVGNLTCRPTTPLLYEWLKRGGLHSCCSSCHLMLLYSIYAVDAQWTSRCVCVTNYSKQHYKNTHYTIIREEMTGKKTAQMTDVGCWWL